MRCAVRHSFRIDCRGRFSSEAQKMLFSALRRSCGVRRPCLTATRPSPMARGASGMGALANLGAVWRAAGAVWPWAGAFGRSDRACVRAGRACGPSGQALACGGRWARVACCAAPQGPQARSGGYSHRNRCAGRSGRPAGAAGCDPFPPNTGGGPICQQSGALFLTAPTRPVRRNRLPGLF
jgi:hypothetical protein